MDTSWRQPFWHKGRITCLWIKSVFDCLTIGIIHETMVVHMTWVWTFFNNYIYICIYIYVYILLYIIIYHHIIYIHIYIHIFICMRFQAKYGLRRRATFVTVVSRAPHNVSNHQIIDCLFNNLFWPTSKKTPQPGLLIFCIINRWPIDFPHKRSITWKTAWRLHMVEKSGSATHWPRGTDINSS